MVQSILWMIYEYFLCLMEVFLFYDFLEVMLKRNEKVRKAYYYLSIILLSLFIFILTQIKIYSMIRTILLFIIFLLIGYKLFKGNVKGKVFFTTMFYLFLLFSDVLAVYILSYSTGKDIKNIVINQTWARVLFSQISKLLLLITLRMVKNNYKEREPDIPKYYWYWILLVYIIYEKDIWFSNAFVAIFKLNTIISRGY